MFCILRASCAGGLILSLVLQPTFLLTFQVTPLWADPPKGASERPKPPRIEVKGQSEPSVCPNCKDTVSAEEIGAGAVLCEEHGVLLHRACVQEIGTCPSCVSLNRKTVSRVGRTLLEGIQGDLRQKRVRDVAQRIQRLRQSRPSPTERTTLLAEIAFAQREFLAENRLKIGTRESRGEDFGKNLIILFWMGTAASLVGGGVLDPFFLNLGISMTVLGFTRIPHYLLNRVALHFSLTDEAYNQYQFETRVKRHLEKHHGIQLTEAQVSDLLYHAAQTYEGRGLASESSRSMASNAEGSALDRAFQFCLQQRAERAIRDSSRRGQ